MSDHGVEEGFRVCVTDAVFVSEGVDSAPVAPCVAETRLVEIEVGFAFTEEVSEIGEGRVRFGDFEGRGTSGCGRIDVRREFWYENGGGFGSSGGRGLVMTTR